MMYAYIKIEINVLNKIMSQQKTEGLSVVIDRVRSLLCCYPVCDNDDWQIVFVR